MDDDREQIKNAFSTHRWPLTTRSAEKAARTKGIQSAVVGDSDTFLTPDPEAGNILAKQLTFLANADGTGLVL